MLISKKKNFYEIILVIASSLFFAFNGSTAFDTSLDIFPFIERSINPSYLSNDFYTNSISNEFNPKQFLGIFISQLAIILNVDWYYILYGLKILYIFCSPIVFFRTLIFLGKRLNTKISFEVIFLGILIGISPLSKLFSIAWWPPYEHFLKPATVAEIFVFFSLLLRKKTIILFLFFQFLGIFLHPAMYCLTSLFVISILSIQFNNNRKYIIEYGFLSLTLIVIYLLTIKIPNFIDTNLFTRIYTLENHSSHYRVPYFGTYLASYLDWKFIFGLMNIVLLTGQLLNNKLVKTGSLIGLILLNASVVMQWIVTDIYPNKIGASLGPVRYTQFIYWYVVLFGAIVLKDFLKLDFKKNKILKKIPSVYYVAISILLILYIRIDNPKEDFLNNHSGIDKFINSTDSNSIFVVYPTSSFKFYFQYALNRSVFNGVGFPFNEKYFEEFQARKDITYGSFEEIQRLNGDWIGEKHQNFFRNLTPKDFLSLLNNYKVDYIIIEKRYNQNFKEFTPFFSNEEVEIYEIDQFNIEI